MDMGEEVVQPLADIDLCQFAASHKGIDDGCVLGGIMVSAEEVVLVSQSQRSHSVLDKVIDEFQEFYNINESVYSDMQNIWDSYRLRSKMNLIVS